MKRILLILSFIGVASLTTHAQSLEKSNYPHWTISKGVQKIQFKNIEYIPAEVTTGSSSIAVSKDIQKANRPAESSGVVTTSGTPDWVVSKGVARVQVKR